MTVLPTVTGLTYDANMSAYNPPSDYGPVWSSTAGDTLVLQYSISATTGEHWGAVAYTSGGGGMYFGTSSPTAGQLCHFSGPQDPVTPLPLCADWGIAVDRTIASLTLTNTPLYDYGNKQMAGTMSGTFTFPKF